MHPFTGEGKSCIVAMLSAVLAIRGAHVDVISSSPMLARRDAEEWEPFFKMFHLTVGVTPTPGLNELGPQEQTAKQREAYQARFSPWVQLINCQRYSISSLLTIADSVPNHC